MSSPSDNRYFSVEYHLSKLSTSMRDSLTSEQLDAFSLILKDAIPKPSPKIVDLRFSIDLIIARYYFVLFVGRDRRKNQRSYQTDPFTKIGNAIAVIVILLAVNLTISGTLVLVGYLFKSMVGIDLFPGHFPDLLKRLLKGG